MNERLFQAAKNGATFDQIFEDAELAEKIYDHCARTGYVKAIIKRAKA